MKPLTLFLAMLMVACGGDKESPEESKVDSSGLRVGFEFSINSDSLRPCAPIETLVVHDTVRVEYAVPLGWHEEGLSFEHTFLKFYGADSLVYQVLRLDGRPLSMNLNYLGYQSQPSNPKREPR